MPHQTIGVAWMIDKEASKLKGGALSDEMGLGKVCEMLYILFLVLLVTFVTDSADVSSDASINNMHA